MKRIPLARAIGPAAAKFFCSMAVLVIGLFPVPSSGDVLPAPVTSKVIPDRDVLEAGKTQKLVVKVTLDAARPPKEVKRPPVNLSLVLDRSGSMSGEKLQKAKEAAIEALRRLGGDDLFSVVAYNHIVQTVVPARSAGDTEWIEARINSFSAGGNTALFGGVSQGAAEVRKNLDKRYVHRIILLSDGIANVGPSSPEDLGRLGVALLKEGISVTTVGVGTDYNEDLMTRLSQKSDGNTYFVESSSDLPRIFSAELGDVLSVVAKKVKVIIECPDGIEPIRIIGREGRIKGQTIELSLNQLYGGQKKFVLVEMNVPGGVTGTKLQVATARISYENPFTQRNETTTSEASARFSDKKDEVLKSQNTEVQKDYRLNLNAAAQERAISLADKGKTKEAANELNASAQNLRELGKKSNDAELLSKADQMEERARQIEQQGMTQKARKEMRTDSFQMQNQQRAR